MLEVENSKKEKGDYNKNVKAEHKNEMYRTLWSGYYF